MPMTSFAAAASAVGPWLATEASTASSGLANERGLMLIAGLGVVAFLVGHVTQRWVSEVIVFLAIGVLVGPDVLNLVTAQTLSALDPVISVALGAIVFAIGERLELPVLRRLRSTLTPIALLENAAVFGLVFLGLTFVGLGPGAAYLLAAIAVSTSPTTLVAVIATKNARGRFTDHMLSLTALNNLVSALLYGLGLPIILTASSPGVSQGVLAFVQLIVFSAVIGLVGAYAMRWLMATLHRSGERLLFVFVTLIAVVAVSRAVGAPVVISTLIMGAVVANDPRDTRPLFGAIKTLEAPIFLIFFVVAGAGIHLEELATVGIPGLVYVLARTIGKVGGGWVGAELTRSGRRAGWGPWIGAALSPFAGMAIGLAAFTLERATEAGLDAFGSQVSAIVLGSVVVFELAGPIAVGRALDTVGDSSTDEDGGEPGAQQIVNSILVPLSNPGMARRKAPQIVDLAASTGAALTGLHVVGPDQPVDGPIPPALRFVSLVAAARDVPFDHVTATGASVADTIVSTARRVGADLIVLGEPFPRRGSASSIVEDVTGQAAPDIRVLVIPTSDGAVEGSQRPSDVAAAVASAAEQDPLSTGELPAVVVASESLDGAPAGDEVDVDQSSD
ncbi:cation:proton antiporter [Salsipaludibacter albus]|uniref:cation:proton antiporter domain-containing protein n=1 Tax=Salsipaludibacter albus TaxID=2849650 RepID=UPI001EE4A647|nr:cation:proton antiporter [Salsipaludibacter albus]MBY5163416.1 cation:proton antiporter [Salsipaludibacter albus]